MTNKPDSRRRAAWLFLQGSAVVLPALTAARLSAEVEQAGVDALEGQLYVAYVGPYVLVWSLIVSLDLIRPPDPRTPLSSSGFRAVLLYASACLGLSMLEGFDISSPQLSWSVLIVWLGAGALPLSVLGHTLVQQRSLSPTRTVLLLLAGVLLQRGVSLLLGVAFDLPPESQGMAMVVGGMTFAVGLGLAGRKEVQSSLRRLVVTMGLVGISAALGSAAQIAHPSLDSLYVTGIAASDPGKNRVLIGVERPAMPLPGFVELDLEEGSWRELSRRVDEARYVDGRRVTMERGRLGVASGTSQGNRLCFEGSGAEAAGHCSGSLPRGRRFSLTEHPYAARVLLARSDYIEVQDFETGQVWSVGPQAGNIRWPCFAEGGQVLWRLQSGAGPYQQFAFELEESAARPRRLDLSHEIQCLPTGVRSPDYQFIRGSRRLGRNSRLEGPGLPEGGIGLGPVVVVADWSADGKVLMVLHEGGWVQTFSAAGGLSDPIALGPTQPPRLNRSGSRFAHVVETTPGSPEVLVRKLPGGDLLWRFPVQTPAFSWDGRGRLLVVEDWSLRRFDPDTGRMEEVFPPPP